MRTTKPYEAHGLRIFLVKEDGVKLAERPILRTPSEAAPILARFIGEPDREMFVVALLTIRHRLIGFQHRFRGLSGFDARSSARGIPAGDSCTDQRFAPGS